MIDILKNKMPKPLFALFMLCVLLCSGPTVWADGSKDLYPAGAKGGRATLRSNTVVTNAFPFPTQGDHFVYVNAGERIALASSVSTSSHSGKIKLFDPQGNAISLTTLQSSGGWRPTYTYFGDIADRTQELAGPRLPGQTAGSNRYQPIYHTAATSGIYKVQFLGSGTTDNDNGRDNQAATAAWTQNASSVYIKAWDVSVAKQVGSQWQWANGRVYANVLNMDIPTVTSNSPWPFSNIGGFYGKFKVLTNDGYVYNVDNNGNNGLSFTFMVNNRGFHDVGKPGVSSYKSILATDAVTVQARYHDPRAPDTQSTVTHKIFYNNPDTNLPAMALLNNTQTWLRHLEKQLAIDDLSVIGVEGVINQLGKKGGFIVFENDGGGDYEITINPKPGGTVTFTPRILEGTSIIGENRIFWDGKDGDGNLLASGEVVKTLIGVKLKGAEVHFPYIDMEINPFGIKLDLLTADLLSIRSQQVFWNDTDMPNVATASYGSNSNPKNASHTVLPNGQDSHMNGHRWGASNNTSGYTTSTTGTFGDNKGMDTWTFVQGETFISEVDLEVKVADLEISAIIQSKTSIKPDGEITYTIKARNNGPSTVEKVPFSFIIPPGFDPKNLAFNGRGCGTENTQLTYNVATRTYSSTLSLPNACEIEYTITMDAISNISEGNHNFTATIMRPNDVSDPDATNPNPVIPPTDPFYECNNNGLGGTCNNIKTSSVSYTISDLCIEDTAGKSVSWTLGWPATQRVESATITLPGTNGGFIFDIYELDDSFNMQINGTLISSREMRFQARNSPHARNIRFLDGSLWGTGSFPEIYSMLGQANKPIVRVEVSILGQVSVFGSKVSASNPNYALEPLVLFGGNTFNNITWKSNALNSIIVSQTRRLADNSKMNAYGYGQNFVECETYTLKKQGVFNDENGDGIAQSGETISYTLTVKNTGDIDIYNLKVNDPLLGGDIAGLPSGDTNSNGVLNKNEEWVYTVTYVINQADIISKGVYNLASVVGLNVLNEDLDPETSVDPNPLLPSDPNYDPSRPHHTFVLLKGRSLMISNPNIYQRVKRN